MGFPVLHDILYTGPGQVSMVVTDGLAMGCGLITSRNIMLMYA